MDGYKKVILRNHKNEIILPQTTASMVSEEAERRFVDNVEKSILNKLATESIALDELLTNHTALSALAKEQLVLLGLADKIPKDMDEWSAAVEDLNPLRPFVDDIINGIGVMPTFPSDNSDARYEASVDDSDPLNPHLVVKLSSEFIAQPAEYNSGATWTVTKSAPPVKLSIPVDKIVFDTTKQTISSLPTALGGTPVEDDIKGNLINGAEDIEVASIGDNIPQAFVSFDIEKYLSNTFGKTGLSKTMRRFTMNVLSKPIKGDMTKTQAYLDGNVVQPTRENLIVSNYSDNSFSYLTWATTMDTEIINRILNGNGMAALVVFGGAASTISLTKPEVEVYIDNPYAGQTLVATKNMGAEFNILDWEVQGGE